MFAGLFDFEWLPGWMTEGYTFIIIMVVLLLGLVGLMLYLRKQGTDDE